MEEDKTTKERKALHDTDLLYLNVKYFGVSHVSRVKQFPEILMEMRKGLKIGKVLKSIIEYMEISDGRSKYFSRMCQYVFKNAPSISCVGNRKQQRIFLEMFIEQYRPFISRSMCAFTSDYHLLYDNASSLWKQDKEDDNNFMRDLRLSRYILHHHINSTVCTWRWIHQRLSEKNRTRFNTPEEFSSYFCDMYPEIHNDHIDMCRPQETLMQWIKETPITIKNSNVYIENGQIFLLYDLEYLEGYERDLDNPDILHVPNVGFHLKSFNEDLNLPILLRKIIYNFLKRDERPKRSQLLELINELITDHSQPILLQSTKTILNEDLLNAIIENRQQSIFWTTKDSFELFIEGHGYGKGDGQVILDILRIKYRKGEDISNEELFEEISKHIKTRVPSVEDLEAFMTKYQSIFGPFEPHNSDSEPQVNDNARDDGETVFEAEMTWEKLNQDVFQWLEKSENTSKDVSSTEKFELLTRKLMKLGENASKICAAKRNQDDFENLAPEEDLESVNNESSIIDL